MTRLSESFARFCGLLTLAEEYFVVGDSAAAAGLAQIAACYAFPANVGLFSSPRLERLLLELGKRIQTGGAPRARNRGQKLRHVLHVLSYAKPIGGDSRFAWRWIQKDSHSRHSVAITTQSEVAHLYDIPKVLKDAVIESGGFLQTLRAPTSMPMEKAKELRLLCQEADVVVLHLYPYDIIPVLALAAGCDSVKTLFVNHSDHTFWIGASVAHSIVHLRAQSAQFLINRRGLKPERSSMLPVPIDKSASTPNRTDAKRALGYDPDVLLLLTIASPFKYSSPGQVSFLELVAPVIAQCRQVVLVAVGPECEGAWRIASSETNGRIVALGRRWDNDVLYTAADIYADSVPFSSTTSLLEAGRHGVPLLGYSPLISDLQLLGPGAPGLDNSMELGRDTESYRALLTRLITDPEFRRQSGKRAQTQILSLHDGSEWLSALDRVYGSLESNDRGCLQADSDVFDESALNLALAKLFGQVQGRMRLRQLIGQHIGALRYASRFPITWRLRARGFDLCYLNLLPPPADAIARRAGRQAKRLLARS